jgi:hypothetical protein
MKIAGSGTGAVSGSVIQRYGSADPDPDPYQNVTYQYRVGSVDPDPDSEYGSGSRRAKITQKSGKNFRNFMF